MNNTCRHHWSVSVNILLMVLIILLIFANLGMTVKATGDVSDKIVVDIIEVGSNYFKVSGTTSLDYMEKGFQYRKAGSQTWEKIQIFSRIFQANISGTLGSTYEVRAYCVMGAGPFNTLYSATKSVKIHTDPEIVITPSSRMNLYTEDGDLTKLRIEFRFDVILNGNTLDKVTLEVEGPNLSQSWPTLPSVPHVFLYSTLVYGVYSFTFVCHTDSGDYQHKVSYLTGGPSPTPAPKPTSTPKPTPTPSPSPEPSPSTHSSTIETTATLPVEETTASQTTDTTTASSSETSVTSITSSVEQTQTTAADPDSQDNSGGTSTIILVILGVIAAALVSILALMIRNKVMSGTKT